MDSSAATASKQADERATAEPQQGAQNQLMQELNEADAQQIDEDASDEAESRSSDLDSSDTSDDDDNDDKLLRLIEEADDEDEMADVGGNGPSTRNEVVDPHVNRPTIDVVPETATLSELGVIQSIVGASVIIRAHRSAERQVIDSESVVALGDRRVVGLVFDVFGPVTRPLYSVRFPAPEDIDASVYAVGTPVFYSPELARMVDTSTIRIKGTDASNEYDEEAGSDTMEFSDDETERLHRRQKKGKKAPAHQNPRTNALQPPPPPQQQQQQQPSVSGRNIQSYQDLYDADLGF
ncbi:hypothetical protein GGI22_006407 [Coemansia erecta]|nr:hypothetical protein GGI22_006407 [Coemansia erecta]